MLEYVCAWERVRRTNCVCMCVCVCVRTERSGPKTWHVNSCGLVLHFLGATGARSLQKKIAVCVKNTHIMHLCTCALDTHSNMCATRCQTEWKNSLRGALQVTATEMKKINCISGCMWVCLCYVWRVCAPAVHVPVRVNMCVRARLCMCAQWCPAGGCSCRSCLCSRKVKG